MAKVSQVAEAETARCKVRLGRALSFAGWVLVKFNGNSTIPEKFDESSEG
jgi:hypothetical protein